MTAIATVCAMLPLVFGTSESGSIVSQSLAIVVIGGLIVATLLTRFSFAVHLRAAILPQVQTPARSKSQATNDRRLIAVRRKDCSARSEKTLRDGPSLAYEAGRRYSGKVE
ncbi:efflux RND transporter permease subunit [Cohnella faecalis]